MTSPSYPAALDALANPGPTTETDDAGYELDVVVARLQNCVMAIEGKLGIGTGGPPASASVLRRSATGSSGWGPVQTADITAGAISQVGFTTLASQSGSPVTASNISGGQINLTATGGPCLFLAAGSVTNSAAAGSIYLSIGIDAVDQGGYWFAQPPAPSYYIPFGFIHCATPAAGARVFNMLWRGAAGQTLTLLSGLFWIIELKR